MQPLPKHEGVGEVSLPELPSFFCGCCKQTLTNCTYDRCKVSWLP